MASVGYKSGGWFVLGVMHHSALAIVHVSQFNMTIGEICAAKLVEMNLAHFLHRVWLCV